MFYSDYTGFKGIHRYFADFMVSFSGDLTKEERYYLWLACGLLSYFVEKGHICIDLTDLAGREFCLDEDEPPVYISCPPLEPWMDALKASDVVGSSGEARPIVLKDNMLYFNRYWHYEKIFIEKILKKVKTKPGNFDRSLMESVINRLFSEIKRDEIDLQREAALNAIENNFLVISGGPGTGKTFTIAKILGLLAEIASNDLSVALATPTGKAAARLKGMIKDIKERINCSEHIKKKIPEDVITIHRLLGSSYRTKKFKYNENNPLPYDVIIVDEASMVDLPLMSKLLEATRDQTKLILVGDKDQLSSVEPGSVFGDICDAIKNVAGAIVILKKNYRFGENSGIGRLSELVKQGEGLEALDLLKEGRFEDIRWRKMESPFYLKEMVEKYIIERYGSYINARDIDEAFKNFEAFHVLCALRHGPYGVISLNELIENILWEKKLIKTTKKRWYKGKPIMITTNDYALKLFNGDMGIAFEDPEDKDALRVFFKTEEGLRKVAPPRIADFETAYAITVHKSQGSEFDDVVFILSDMTSEIFTRELIYTAITRARRSIEIWGTEEIFLEAVQRRIERKSGIKKSLLF
ncbi:MAG: exodeoxyribonuclease V subunit alpha [Syntrophorhabdaceae bacterium]|nr:exodeoxyribonuclease V subunit alpha [Syntrophorhabdaceae bacterium]